MGFRRRGFQPVRSMSGRPEALSSRSMRSAMAGALATPGDCMPAAWKRPGTVLEGPIMKSLTPSMTARPPAKARTMRRVSRSGTSLRAPSSSAAMSGA